MAGPPRVALITGAARRVGAAIARRLHAAGYAVALHYRHSADEARALAQELERERGDSTLILAAELADLDALPRLVAKVHDRFGRLDALVNNASAFFPTPLGRATPAQWQDLFAANAQAPFFLSQAAADALRATRGAIVNLVDVYAERPLADHPIYCMAKGALLAMTRALALDLAPEVRVNGVAPGAVLWPGDGASEGDRDALIARTPLKRIGSPEDVADAVHWLLQAPFVTGQIVPVDGGRTLSV